MRTDKLPERLRDAIAARGISRNDIATALGIDRSTVDHWLSGDRRPRTDTLERLAIVLGVRPGDLAFGPEESP
jgi:transcriptional regulator with XRE-family HTH domain